MSIVKWKQLANLCREGLKERPDFITCLKTAEGLAEGMVRMKLPAARREVAAAMLKKGGKR
jgi:hypothetical protein